MKYYLCNSLANNGIKPNLEKNIKVVDVVGLNFNKFFDELKKEDEVVLVGGDGTLSYFCKEMKDYHIKNNVYLLGAGTGNDFLNDINEKPGKEILINRYLINLPMVHVKGIDRPFIDNMGYGIDGYVCEEADRLKKKNPNTKINYTLIALKGLLKDFKPRSVDLEIDGKCYHYDHVWLAPTMKGRFYGGGMMIAPEQDRNSNKLTVVIYTGTNMLRTLYLFTKIYKGKHTKYKDVVHIFTGNKIHVKFDKPCAAQIDGDTGLEVSEYYAEL